MTTAAIGETNTALDDNRTKLDFTQKNCTKINHFAVDRYQPDPRDSTNESNNAIPCKYSKEEFCVPRNISRFDIFPICAIMEKFNSSKKMILIE